MFPILSWSMLVLANSNSALSLLPRDVIHAAFQRQQPYRYMSGDTVDTSKKIELLADVTVLGAR
ncbi:MAG: hypothetical protein KTR27_02810 [Leptolyngbyaceae cyanobacterium MAG.088]|nr:hypothetical protein [Leptolyngbyaceae cyanobacterium MAG.088]